MHLIKIWYTKGSLQLIQHSVPNVFFTIWNSCIDIDFSLEKHIIYFACDITYSIKSSINLPSLLPREKKNRWLIKRGRSRKCEDRGTSSRSCRGSMSLYRLLYLSSSFVLRARGRDFFCNSTPTPGVIYSNYKSARLPRWDVCNACLAVRGRSNASIIRDPRRSGLICTRESVRACHEPSWAYLSVRVRSAWFLSGKKYFTNRTERRFSLQ